MTYILTNDVFSDEIDKSAFPILGYWERREKCIVERAMVTEVDTMEFFKDGTGVWNQWDDSGVLAGSKDTFTYRVEGRRLIFKYASFLDRSEALVFRIANECLILISDKGMPNEYMEVYTHHASPESNDNNVL